MANPKRTGLTNVTVLSVLVVVAVLYFARPILIPLALSILIAFTLVPLVVRFRHWGLGRVTAALVVFAFAFLLVASGTALMVSQVSDLARKLPQYQQNAQKKLNSVRDSGSGFMSRLTRTVHNVTDGLMPPPPVPNDQRPGQERPVPVEIRGSGFSPLEIAQEIVGSLVELIVIGGVVIVFVLFILIEREELRDRILRLAGAGRVTLTTQVLGDAARRVSRYLIAQLALNVGFGVCAGIGLYFLGVPNPFLWAMLSAVLRYVPYLGIWVAALMPAAVAFAVEPGWVKVPMVLGLFLFIDVTMYNLAEPILYGTSTGLSPLAVLVAAVFWTWLWGPVGLLLATPLTVCVVVIGHHVPRMRFLSILLSDQPTLAPEARLYQRLLAMDVEEATDVAMPLLKSRSLEQLYDEVIVPALTLAEQDRHAGRIDDERERFIFQNARILVEDLADRSQQLASKNDKPPADGVPGKTPGESGRSSEATVMCIPARDEVDAIGTFMVAQLLLTRGIACTMLPAGTLAAEALEKVEQERPAVAVVLAVPPFGYMHTRYVCRRLRQQTGDTKIVAAVLTEQDAAELKQRQPPLVADQLATSLQQVVAHVISLASIETSSTGPESDEARSPREPQGHIVVSE